MVGSSDDFPALDADGEVQEDSRFGRIGGVPLEFSKRERVDKLFPVVPIPPRLAFVAAPNPKNIINLLHHTSIIKLRGEGEQQLFHHVVTIVNGSPDACCGSAHCRAQYLQEV